MTRGTSEMSDESVLVRAKNIRDDRGNRGDTLVIERGRVRAIGQWAQLESEYPDARVEHFPDAVVTPGLIDGHVHPVWGTAMARGVDLRGCTTRTDVVAALAHADSRLEHGHWLFGWGLGPDSLEGPTTNEVLAEAVGSERRVYISMFDAHSALMSDAALSAVGIHEPRTTADGGGFTATPDGRLTGHVLEFSAMNEIAPHVPADSVPQLADRLGDLLSGMARTGLVGAFVPDAQGGDIVVDVLTELERRGELPLRLRISPWCTPELSDEELEALVAGLGRHGRRWRFAGVKLFIDGTIDGGTAWLRSPDSRGDGTTGFWHDPDLYARRVSRLNDLGVPTITHAIGDRGTHFVAETLASLPDRGVVHRIDHLELLDDDTIDLIGRHRIPVCMQPTHCTLFIDPQAHDNWSERVGPARARQGFRTRDLLDAGVTEALGSDWPVAPYDPRAIIADAQLRHPHDRERAPIGPDQALTATQALHGYTAAVYDSVGEVGGRLDAGAPADLTVWARDPFTAAAADVATIPILATAVAGDVRRHQVLRKAES